MAAEAANKKAEREALRGVIQQWNANRLDLFELSEPNEDLEFHGVMRFYFQDSGQKVATKCIRVASDATSQAVIETLIEKFRPDMRMLSVPEYALYEIHENGEERKLGLEEKPLLVQLNWHIDDREGRFLLKRIDDKTNAQGVGFSTTEGTSFRRKLSKREKKQMKKQEKLSRCKNNEQDENAAPTDQNGVAEKLYTELPETSFTRSISNPEAVMRRRRQQQLERKLQQFRSKDGGPDTGGTLKIYGEALCKDVPYKTLLLSVRDSAAQVVREMLSKYGLDKVDPQQYCLVQVNTENINNSAHQEYILDDDECPLAILMNHPSTRGSIMFHVRRRPADYVPRKRKKKPTGKWNELDHRYEDERLPFLLELNPDGTEVPSGAGVRYRLQPNVTEVGSERPVGPQAVQAQTLTLSGPTVMPRHCVIAFTENIVTLTPCSRDAHTYVNNQRIHQTTILQSGAIIKFGRMHTFRFIDPAPEERMRQRQDSNRQLDYAYDRHSPETTNQDASSEKYRSSSQMGITNGGSPGQGQSSSNPSSPSKSRATVCNSSTLAHDSHAPEASTHNYETTFDLDGNVETASLTSSRDGNRLSQTDRQPRGADPILPAVLEFLEETEEAFLHAVITDVEPSAPQFKLAPTYTLYLAARYRASTHYRPELQPTERAHRLTVMLANVATMIQRVIQERYMDSSSLALWLANGSELLHMLKNDRHVGAFSTRAQDILADSVHTAFASLVRCVSLDLAPAMSQFMADADEPAREAGVLQIFSNTMALLRRCRVNAALTIQLFSHLFHAINATAFNALVSNGNLCVRWFGRRLKARLNALETWAERQGLELASQCHLATIMQATHLLQAPKYNAEELATLSSTCFKLNSLQVRALLQKYQPAADEPRLPAELIENVVKVAESVADTLVRADGREIRLEEEPTLALALLLPEDGYSCEVIRGVPPGLAEFLAPLQQDGLCRMAPQPTSSGYWTIYMIDHHSNVRSPSAMSNRSGGYSSHIGQNQGQPEIQVIKLHKSTNGMGLSIVAAKGAGQDRLGIYIKSVVAGGAADADGRLTAGDQLLKVDGQSLVGITQEKAAEYLVRTGPIVTLEVAKQGAIYHGLATLLSQPSPVMTRANKSRPRSEQLEPPRVLIDRGSTSHSVGNLALASGSTKRSLGTSAAAATHSYHEEPATLNWDVDHASYPHMQGSTEMQFYFDHYNHQSPSRSLSSNQLSYQDGRTPQRNLDLDLSRPNMNLPLASTKSPTYYASTYPFNGIPLETLNGEMHQSRSRDYLNSPPAIIEESTDQIFLTVPTTYTYEQPSYLFPASSQSYNYEKYKSAASNLNRGKCFYKNNAKLPSGTNELSFEDDDVKPKAISFDGEPSIPYIDENLQESCITNMEESPTLNEENETKNSSPAKVKEPEQICWSNTDLCVSEKLTNIDNKNVAYNLHQKSSLHDLLVTQQSSSKYIPTCILSEEKSWQSPEEVRLGYGRVVALAKHFSKLDGGGLIRFKTAKLADSKQFISEPNMASSEEYPELIEYKKLSSRHFKSETDLRKTDISIDVSPERTCSILLLDIRDDQASKASSYKDQSLIEKKTGKLTKEEQNKIIEEIRELSNLDESKPKLIDSLKFLSLTDLNSESATMNSKSYSNFKKLSLIPSKAYSSVFNISETPSILDIRIKTLRNKGNSVIKIFGRVPKGSFDRISNDNDDKDVDIGDTNRINVRKGAWKSRSWEMIWDGTREIKTRSSSFPTIHHCAKVIQIAKRRETESQCSCARSASNLLQSLNDDTNDGAKLYFYNTCKDQICTHQFHKSRQMRKLRKKPTICVKLTKSDPDISERKTLFMRKENGKRIFSESPLLESDLHLHVGTEGKQHHEVFNPGYSRASSSNSVTPPVQPPPMPAINGATSLRSRSSHNLHDPLRMGTLPPSGLVSRQQSSPNLNPNQSHGHLQTNMHINEAERFYQNVSVYRNQDPMAKQPSPLQRPDDRSLLPSQRSSRGSQNSLNRPLTHESNQDRDRPISAYIPQTQQQGYSNNQMQQQQGPPPPRSQSSRDIIRQEAKLQEMQEEVRRRELRGNIQPQVLGQYRPNTHNMRPVISSNQIVGPGMRASRPLGSTPNLAPSLTSKQMIPNYNYSDAQYSQYGNKQHMPVAGQMYSMASQKGKNEQYRDHSAATEYNQQDPRIYPHQNQSLQYGPLQNSSQYNDGNGDLRNGQYAMENNANPMQGMEGGNAMEPSEVLSATRPILQEDEYRESPPPPPPNASTHPLYKPTTDTKYTASMQDPPRGGYYPAVSGAPQQPRQYHYSATNPWQREEREKEQARRREAARQWRDQQIAELSALPNRTAQQEEQLRALQLERDFQRRAEEAASQQDDDEESNDLDNESTQRVQDLLRMAAAQGRTNQMNSQHVMSKINTNHPTMKGTLAGQVAANQIQLPNVSVHNPAQQGNSMQANSYTSNNEPSNLHALQQQSQNPSQNNNNNNNSQAPMSPTYGSPMGQFGNALKISQNNEEKERQRRIEDANRRQMEFDENQRKRDDEIRQQQIHTHQQQQQIQHGYHQTVPQNFRNQQQLHPGMLRLDNLVINGPSVPPESGNNDAPPPPERGSSYAVMSQQSALRSNSSTVSNTPVGGSLQSSTIKRVSFHDPNANIETNQRTGPTTNSSLTPSSTSMDTIREDPNNFINDAENMLASPKTPEGPGGLFNTATPGVIGAQEVYRDPRQKRLAEKQKQQQQHLQMGAVPEKLSFKEKMKMFAMETGENGTPRDKVKISRAQREIDNIGSPLSPNNNNRS
ncbi:uncharacterized protein cno isoform X2 [Prorops nasuta]|uniref:uncharacterized protein cno isoform X2 n=1 Tax=Prorops nasuta TaxID=863751 RepID=UPI0034CDDEFC